jgi:hypothetical protein
VLQCCSGGDALLSTLKLRLEGSGWRHPLEAGWIELVGATAATVTLDFAEAILG